MSVTNRQFERESAHVEKPETPRDNEGYTAPKLHVIGKAGDLVQGGGGNTADNNRARQY